MGAAAPAVLRSVVSVLLFWPGCDKVGSRPGGPRLPGPAPSRQRDQRDRPDHVTEWITSQVGDDPDLLANVVPDYPATGKRTLQDNGSWLRTLTRENVDLVRTGITRIEPDAVVTDDGARYDADFIVYATGFQANKMLWPMTIVGRGGEILSERWGERPSAYLGITVPGFPNFFCMYGPVPTSRTAAA